MANIKLVLEYDGTHFNGWQLQPEQRTVQGTVEAALSRLTAEPIRVHCAGRTDSGVHALGQVVNFHCGRVWNPEIYVNGGNGLLPRDVRILSAEPVADDFHSRYSARSRSYRYQISRRVCAVGRLYRWQVPYELDVPAMASAVRGLVGEHDFESFCQAGSGLHHFRCLVHRVDWQRQGDELIFEITANRFVHNMVRILVGTSVEVGRGRRHPQEMPAILQARDRRVAGPTAPAHGLLLTAVGY